jgi:hypothetical protein
LAIYFIVSIERIEKLLKGKLFLAQKSLDNHYFCRNDAPFSLVLCLTSILLVMYSSCWLLLCFQFFIITLYPSLKTWKFLVLTYEFTLDYSTWKSCRRDKVPRIILDAIIKLGLLFLCVNVYGLIYFFRSGEDVSTSERIVWLSCWLMIQARHLNGYHSWMKFINSLLRSKFTLLINNSVF